MKLRWQTNDSNLSKHRGIEYIMDNSVVSHCKWLIHPKRGSQLYCFSPISISYWIYRFCLREPVRKWRLQLFLVNKLSWSVGRKWHFPISRWTLKWVIFPSPSISSFSLSFSTITQRVTAHFDDIFEGDVTNFLVAQQIVSQFLTVWNDRITSW